MKKNFLVCRISLVSAAMAALCIGSPSNLLADPPPATAPVVSTTPAPALPYGVAEVVKMYQGGISKEILIGFVDSSSLPMHLTADGIIYLQHLGLPQGVIAAIIRRDGELQKQSAAAYPPQQMAAATPGAPAPGGPAPAVVTPGTPPPQVPPYNYSSAPPAVAYPDYGAYPYYGYPYYGPDVVVAGGWYWGPGGWYWGRGGWGGGWGRGGFGGRGGFHR